MAKALKGNNYYVIKSTAPHGATGQTYASSKAGVRELRAYLASAGHTRITVEYVDRKATAAIAMRAVSP